MFSGSSVVLLFLCDEGRSAVSCYDHTHVRHIFYVSLKTYAHHADPGAPLILACLRRFHIPLYGFSYRDNALCYNVGTSIGARCKSLSISLVVLIFSPFHSSFRTRMQLSSHPHWTKPLSHLLLLQPYSRLIRRRKHLPLPASLPRRSSGFRLRD